MSLILQKIYHSTYKYQLLEDEIVTMMQKKKIPQDLQDRALEYFDYCWRK